MDLTSYRNSIWSLLPSVEDPLSKILINAEILRFYEEGWSLDDAVHYLLCLEDVDPTIPEDEAIEMMRSINEKYWDGM